MWFRSDKVPEPRKHRIGSTVLQITCVPDQESPGGLAAKKVHFIDFADSGGKGTVSLHCMW